MNLLAVGIGGMLGAVSRFFLSTYILPTTLFPFATLCANIAGSFIFAYLARQQWLRNQQVKLLITTGFLGSFTTLSAFSLEAFQMLKKNDFIAFTCYVGGSLIFCLSASAFGFYLGGKKK